ncbi:MAG: SDR family NAD(P)-dependent oxidoreductase [Erythrobacter sp.]
MTSKVCVVTGVGPGTGKAIAQKFAAEGYQVAMIARNGERLDAIAAETANTHGFVCNVADFDALDQTLAEITRTLGPPSVLIHNAVRGTRGTFLEVEPEQLEKNFRINTLSLHHMARALAPAMIDAGEGAIIATGNTAAYRGKDFFAAFAPTKAAQRILLESMARTAGPKGVHVGYVAIDAVIDVPWTREAFVGRPDEFFSDPADIASEIYHMAHQPKSAWTFETVIRPFGESW